jgi:hypothetical protein
LDVTQSFLIETIDPPSASFLATAYSHTLGRQRMRRSEADMIAFHTKGDLRKLAMAAEMENLVPGKCGEYLPASVFGVDLDADLFKSRNRLVRVLNECEDIPIGLRDTGSVDILDCVFSMLNAAELPVDLQDHMRILNDLSFAANCCVDERVAADLVLRSISNSKGYPSDSLWRHALGHTAPKSVAHPEELIEPFFSAKEAWYICANARRLGTTLHHLGMMAQLSNASEFSSRRVRCVLDQFAGAVSEISELRSLFPRQ